MIRRVNRRVMLRLVNRWQFENGKVIACDEYFDTAAALVMQDRIEEVLPDEAGAKGQ
jgi:hypothetical protein